MLSSGSCFYLKREKGHNCIKIWRPVPNVEFGLHFMMFHAFKFYYLANKKKRLTNQANYKLLYVTDKFRWQGYIYNSLYIHGRPQLMVHILTMITWCISIIIFTLLLLYYILYYYCIKPTFSRISIVGGILLLTRCWAWFTL